MVIDKVQKVTLEERKHFYVLDIIGENGEKGYWTILKNRSVKVEIISGIYNGERVRPLFQFMAEPAKKC